MLGHMKRRGWRRAAAILAIPVLVLLAPAAGAVSVERSGSFDSIHAPSPPPQSANAAPAPCDDRAYTLIGGKWKEPLGWLYQSSSTPSGLGSSAVLTVLKRSFDNMTGARNDCGMADTVSATSTYLGTSSLGPSVTKRGNCAAKDGHNVLGFGSLPFGILAVTCTRSNNGRMTEIDIRINSKVDWALSVSTCAFFEELLEPTMTHEIGHAFGLGHVSEAKHGRLTMSTTSDGPCSNAESTLGRGDVRGLRHLYPL
jgi:hypothetical protein